MMEEKDERLFISDFSRLFHSNVEQRTVRFPTFCIDWATNVINKQISRPEKNI